MGLMVTNIGFGRVSLFDTTVGGLLSKSFEISGVRVREPCGATNTSPRCEVPMLVLVRIGVRIAGADVFLEP